MRLLFSPRNSTQRFLNFLLSPHWILLIPATLSGLAWFIPDEYGFYKGFTYPEKVNVLSLGLVISWYLLIALFTYFAFNTGKKVKILNDVNTFSSLDNVWLYRFYSWVSIIGLSATIYSTISYLGFGAFINAVASFTTNTIADAIYEQGYSVGLYSLRYVIIISFALACFRLYKRKKFIAFDAINILLFLIYIVFWGRRLQLICSLLVFLCLANSQKDMMQRINIKKFYTFLIFGLILLVSATVLRNYGTYLERGYSNPIIVTFANVIEYLASPFQVSLSIGNNLEKALNSIPYREFTNISTALTTNSAFAGLIYKLGIFVFPYIILISIVFGFLAGFFFKNKHNYLYLGYPVILYAYSEVWRIELFFKGIFLTLLITSIGAVLIHTILCNLSKRKLS